MDLTTQIIIRNNKFSILNTLESIVPLNSKVLVANIGSNDGTVDLCREMGCQVFNFELGTGHDYIRNFMCQKSNTDWQLYLHPWESLIQGHQNIISEKYDCTKITIIQNSFVSQETRVWKKSKGFQFRNPIYEILDTEGVGSDSCVSSLGDNDYKYNLERVKEWKDRQPANKEPYYYYAASLLALGMYDDFLNAAEHYMFLEPKPTKNNILNRYYYALVQVFHKRQVKPALQNLNICISIMPLMAEFWCLIGDIYYHLYNKFSTSKEFYENALLLGNRRLVDDGWPMDVSKYDEYPNKMILSCNEIISKNAIYKA